MHIANLSKWFYLGMTCLHSHPLGNLLALEKRGPQWYFFCSLFCLEGKRYICESLFAHYFFSAAERAQVKQFFKDSALSDRPVVCP